MKQSLYKFIFSFSFLLQLFVGFLFFVLCTVKIVSFAVYYDPATNTYVYDQDNNTTGGKDEFINEGSNDSETDTGYDASSSIEGLVIDEVSSLPDLTPQFIGPLGYLQRELWDYRDDLLRTLYDQYEDLYERFVHTDGEIPRIEVLQCLGIIEEQDDVADRLSASYQKLLKDIKRTSTDLYNSLDALGTKINQNLLDDLEKTLEIAAMQNKVATYFDEYTNMIHAFYELMLEDLSVDDEEIRNLSERDKEFLQLYDQRVQTYEQVQESYNEFIAKTSVSNVLVGPNLPDIVDLIDRFQVLHLSYFRKGWIDNIVAYAPYNDNVISLLNKYEEEARDRFVYLLNKEINSIIGDLYPFEDFQLINKSILNLRSAYTKKSGIYDCRAFAENATIDFVGPVLEEQMQDILDELANSMKSLMDEHGFPKTIDDLNILLSNDLSGVVSDIQNNLLREYKDIILKELQKMGVEFRTHPFLAKQKEWENIVREFLQNRYISSWKQGDLKNFYKIVNDAKEKIDSMLVHEKTKTYQLMLKSIDRAIYDFIK